MLPLLLPYVVLAGLVAWVASRRRRSPIVFFLLSVVASPLVGLPIVLLMRPGPPRTE